MAYTIVLEEGSDGGFVVSVPALPGCVSQGVSHDDAMKNIREALNLYIADCKNTGDPVPLETTKPVV